MRWSIVQISGVALGVVGVAGLLSLDSMHNLSIGPMPAASAALASLAIGVLMTCAGAALRPKRLYRAKPARRRLFGPQSEAEHRAAAAKRQFGTKGRYAPRPARPEAPRPEFREVKALSSAAPTSTGTALVVASAKPKTVDRT